MGPLEQLAARQDGVVTAAQAAQVGVRSTALSRLVQRGWSRPLPGIYVVPGVEGEAWRARAALLWAGPRAVLSHQAAGRLHGFDGMGEEVHVTIPPEQRLAATDFVTVHRGVVPAEDCRMLRGFAVTTAARTLIDLAAVLGPLELDMALESALRRRAVQFDWVERRLRSLASGRRGAGSLREALEASRARRRPLDSALEVRLWHALRASSLPLPVAGHGVEDDEGPPMRLDFAYVRQRLAVECDGFAVHAQRAMFERDAVRLSRLAAAGWRVVHVTYVQLHQPAAVIARIERALGRRRR